MIDQVIRQMVATDVLWPRYDHVAVLPIAVKAYARRKVQVVEFRTLARGATAGVQFL